MLIHEVLKWELNTLERTRPYRANEIPHRHLRLQSIKMVGCEGMARVEEP